KARPRSSVRSSATTSSSICKRGRFRGRQMTKTDCRMPKQFPNDEMKKRSHYMLSGFVLRHSFVIRHSCFVILLALSIGTAPAQKRPITEKDLWDFVWIGDPQVSPDGSRIAFVRVTVNDKKEGY